MVGVVAPRPSGPQRQSASTGSMSAFSRSYRSSGWPSSRRSSGRRCRPTRCTCCSASSRALRLRTRPPTPSTTLPASGSRTISAARSDAAPEVQRPASCCVDDVARHALAPHGRADHRRDGVRLHAAAAAHRGQAVRRERRAGRSCSGTSCRRASWAASDVFAFFLSQDSKTHAAAEPAPRPSCSRNPSRPAPSSPASSSTAS